MKKIKNLCFVAIGMMALMASSCKKDTDPDFPVQFDLKLLDSTGQSLNTFKEGDTITVSFELYNKTNEDVVMFNFMPDLVCSFHTDFFIIYQHSSSINSWKDLGKVCTNYTGGCTRIGTFSLKAHEAYKIQYKWPSIYENCATGNDKLTKGDYRTGLNYTFKSGGGNSSPYYEKNINTTLYFTIQ